MPGRVIDRDEDVVKEAYQVRDYNADTEVKERQADIYNIDMDHATKVLTPSVKVAAPVKADVPSTRRKRGVVIWDPEEKSSAKTPTETSSKDKGKGILVEEPKPIKKKQQVELDEAYARKIQEEFNQDIDSEAAMDHSHEQLDKETKRAIKYINQTPAQKAAKRRKLIEEAKSIKQHLQIVPDEDDDVFTKATPLARKVPVVDYHVILVNNKPRYKIIKADDTY
nr:hypothetical protein [Tanacetum cinerariifolium]